MTWEPIETGPRDGSVICVQKKDGSTFDGYYEPHEWFWDMPWVVCGTVNRVHNSEVSRWSRTLMNPNGPKYPPLVGVQIPPNNKLR